MMDATNWLMSPAKLNLFLHVTGRRPDGYHNLQTLFQLLDYGDYMRFSHRDDELIVLNSPDLDIPDEENLVYRAAQRLRNYSGYRRGANIELRKTIPSGGGLGGGSSNAATTLIALDQLWQLGTGIPGLSRIGASLGADVPVFVEGHSAWAEGTGSKLQPVPVPARWYLVIKPPCTVSTGQIFSRQELTRNTSPIKIAAFFEQGGKNDCEPVVTRLYPEVGEALEWLREYAPAQLTGTGACLFAAFSERREAEALHRQLPDKLEGFVARGVDTSPLHEQLGLS